MRSNAQIIKKTLRSLGLSCILLLVIVSCKNNQNSVTLKFVDLTSEMETLDNDSITPDEFKMLSKKYPDFFNNWFYEVMGMSDYLPQFKLNGRVSDTVKASFLTAILKRNTPVFKYIKKHYDKYPNLNADITNAFNKLKKVIPKANMPVIYRYISNFSYYNTFSVYNDTTMHLGYSAEMFFNDTFPYSSLEVEDFYNRYNATSYIPKALVWNYLNTYYNKYHTHSNALEEAIFQGKVWYMLEQIFGSEQLYKTLGYKAEEWKFFKEEEGNSWQFLIKENVLYQTDAKKYERYFIRGNETFGLPVKCPPMLGAYQGYRIVKDYLKKTGASDEELWKETKGTVMLQKSGYNPVR